VAGCRWRATGGRTGSLPGWPLVLVLLLVPTGLGTARPGGLAAPDFVAPSGAELLPGPNLTVSPSSDWVADGNSTPLDAVWTSGGFGCSLLPSWFQWSVNSTQAGGLLFASNASIANFTGVASQTETTVVELRSAATLTCGNSTLGVFRTAYANVTTVAPLVVEDLALTPLLSGSGTTNLSALVEGGVAPYRVQVRWGDGNLTEVSLPSRGPVAASHAYATGSFLAELTVADSSGLEASATAAEPVQAGPGGAVAILSSVPVAEVGQSVRFTELANEAARSAHVGLSACGSLVIGVGVSSIHVTCDPTAVGSLAVALRANGTGVDGSPLVRLTEPVVPALAVSVVPARADSEADQPVCFEVKISGGAPPFAVAGSFEGLPLPSEAPVPADGSLLVVATAPSAGLAALSLVVTDADGVAVLDAAATVLVEPSLLISLTTSTVILSSVAQVTVVASLTGGVGPIGWVVSPTPESQGGGLPTGEALPDSSFAWTGEFASEGIGAVGVTVAEAGGPVVRTSASAPLLAPLSGEFHLLAIDPSSGPALNLTADLTDGVPPFSVWVNVTGSPAWNATDPAAGLFSATLPLGRTGVLSVAMVAVDALGGRVVARTNVVAYGSLVVVSAPPSPPDVSPYLGLGLAVALAGGGSVLYLRHRRRSAPPPPTVVDPVKVLEGILTPADGAERVTVELLAEEAGIPLDTVRSTLTRLIASGRVRSEISPEGMEVLAWSTLSPP